MEKHIAQKRNVEIHIDSPKDLGIVLGILIENGYEAYIGYDTYKDTGEPYNYLIVRGVWEAEDD